MPFFGLELLDMARDVAAFNLPARGAALRGQLVGTGATAVLAARGDGALSWASRSPATPYRET